MYRNLTRAGSNMDSRRKSSGGLLGNFPRKSSAVLNSAQRRGVANTPDKGVSGGGQGPGQGTGSIRRSGGENKAPFAGGGVPAGHLVEPIQQRRIIPLLKILTTEKHLTRVEAGRRHNRYSTRVLYLSIHHLINFCASG